MNMQDRRKYGHEKVKDSYYLYTVFNTKTQETIITDGTAEECANVLGKTIQRFYEMVFRVESRGTKKWRITKSFADERYEDMANNKCRKGVQVMSRFAHFKSMNVNDLSRFMMSRIGDENFPCSMVCGEGCKAKSTDDCQRIINEWLSEKVLFDSKGEVK